MCQLSDMRNEHGKVTCGMLEFEANFQQLVTFMKVVSVSWRLFHSVEGSKMAFAVIHDMSLVL